MVRGSRHNDYKINALNKRSKIHEAKTKRIEETDNSATIVGDFITLLSIIDRTTKQNINKKKEDEPHCKSTIPNRCIQNTPPQKSRIHTLSQTHMESSPG